MHNSIENLILLNMIDSGTCKRGDNEVAIFRTLNNDYIIELTRNELSRWDTQSGSKYLCRLNFKNNLNILVLELVTTENNISLFLESIYQYLEFNMNNITIPFNSINSNFNSYQFNFIKNPLNPDNHILNILQYNPLSNSYIIRISIEFDEYRLSDFLNELYFIYLIDIDEYLINNPEFLF